RRKRNPPSGGKSRASASHCDARHLQELRTRHRLHARPHPPRRDLHSDSGVGGLAVSGASRKKSRASLGPRPFSSCLKKTYASVQALPNAWILFAHSRSPSSE